MVKRNNSIDIFRIICAILVVSIHIHPLEEINPFIGFFISNVLSRVAVPFFFAVSGYYYMKGMYKNNYIEYLFRLLKLYIIWSIIYTFIQLIVYINNGATVIGFIWGTILSFFITGSYYHLWYVIGLIISLSIVTLFYKYNHLKLLYLLSIFFFILGCLGCSYYKIGVKIPIFSSLIQNEFFDVIRKYFCMGLPFFMSSYLIIKIEHKFKSLNNKYMFVLLLIICILYLAEIFVVIKFNIMRDIILTFMLYPLTIIIILLLLSNPLPGIERISAINRYFSELIYFIHPLFIFIFDNLINGISSTPLFFLVLLSCTLLGAISIKFKKGVKLNENTK